MYFLKDSTQREVEKPFRMACFSSNKIPVDKKE